MLGRGHRGYRRRGQGCPRKIYRFVEPSLLLLLHQGEAHGYELKERLAKIPFADLVGGAQTAEVDSSVIYRALRAMEKEGLVESSWDTTTTSGPPRRVYRLTEQGDQALAAWVADLQETARVLLAFLQEYAQHMKEGEGAYHP